MAAKTPPFGLSLLQTPGGSHTVFLVYILERLLRVACGPPSHDWYRSVQTTASDRGVRVQQLTR
jgi:hypothetical protein